MTGLEISDDMKALEELLADGEIDFDDPQAQEIICKWAEEQEENRNGKADNIAALVKEWIARAEFRKQEAERLRSRALIDENNAKRLKGYLMFLLQTWGLRKMETPRFSLGIAGNGGKQPLDIAPEYVAEPGRLPVEYQVSKIEINKDAIRDALAAGQNVPGCKLLDRGESLRIK